METAQGAPLELRKWVGCRLAIDRALRGSDKPRCRHQFVSKAEIFAETNVPKNSANAETGAEICWQKPILECGNFFLLWQPVGRSKKPPVAAPQNRADAETVADGERLKGHYKRRNDNSDSSIRNQFGELK